jgi:hypothetical protein
MSTGWRVAVMAGVAACVASFGPPVAAAQLTAASPESPPANLGIATAPLPSPPRLGAPVATPPAPLSDRSREVLRLDCASRLGRREVTLFANGTVRLREGPVGKEWMGLAELGPADLQGALARLSDEDLGSGTDLPAGVVGDWIEHCALVLDLPGKPHRRYEFGRYDTLPLGVSRLRRVAEELGTKVHSLNDSGQLPPGYEVRMGDVLKRVDGSSYRVVNFTSDRKGVELDGLDQPLHLIVLKEQLRLEFVALLSRRP